MNTNDDHSERGKKSRKHNYLLSSIRQNVGPERTKQFQDLFHQVYGGTTTATTTTTTAATTTNRPRSTKKGHEFRVQTPKRLLFYFVSFFLGLPILFFAWKETHWVTPQQPKHSEIHHLRKDKFPSWMDEAAGALHVHNKTKEEFVQTAKPSSNETSTVAPVATEPPAVEQVKNDEEEHDEDQKSDKAKAGDSSEESVVEGDKAKAGALVDKDAEGQGETQDETGDDIQDETER